jgi:hypothetical protein
MNDDDMTMLPPVRSGKGTWENGHRVLMMVSLGIPATRSYQADHHLSSDIHLSTKERRLMLTSIMSQLFMLALTHYVTIAGENPSVRPTIVYDKAIEHVLRKLRRVCGRAVGIR